MKHEKYTSDLKEKILKDITEVEKRARARLINKEHIENIFFIMEVSPKGLAMADGGHVSGGYSWYTETTKFFIEWDTTMETGKSVFYTIQREKAVRGGRQLPGFSINAATDNTNNMRHILFPSYFLQYEHEKNIQKLKETGIKHSFSPEQIILNININPKYKMALIHLYNISRQTYYYEEYTALVTPNLIIPLQGLSEKARKPTEAYRFLTNDSFPYGKSIEQIETNLLVSALANTKI
jgi:hypothetical protein